MTVPPKRDHLLPQNATPLEKALSAVLARILTLPTWLIRAVWDPDLCPERLLPYLAQAWSVDEWDPTWPEATKRQVIKDSVWIHQHKGTIGALRRAIAQLGLGARVVRWFEQTPRARAYTFKLYVGLDDVTAWTGVMTQRLMRVAIANKAVRSFLDAIVLERPAPPTPIYLGGTSHSEVTFQYVLDPVTEITPQPVPVCVGCGIASTIFVRLAPT